MGITNGMPIRQAMSRVHATWSPEEIQTFWYDWFCRETSLYKKGLALMHRVRDILPSDLVDLDRNYVWFKNNCPLHGKLYDDFRIAEQGTDDVLYTVVPAEGYKITPRDAKSCVWGVDPRDGEFKELVRGKWSDIVRFFTCNDWQVRHRMIDETQRFNTICEAERANAHWDIEQRNKRWEEEHEASTADRQYADQFMAFISSLPR